MRAIVVRNGARSAPPPRFLFGVLGEAIIKVYKRENLSKRLADNQ